MIFFKEGLLLQESKCRLNRRPVPSECPGQGRLRRATHTVSG